MNIFIRIILVTYTLLIFTVCTLNPCHAQVEAKPEIKTVTFNIASIPDTYFSKDLNDAKSMIIDGQSKKAQGIIGASIKNTTKRSPLQKGYILEGLDHYQNSKFKEAIISYNNYFKLNAANSDVLFLKGLAQAKLGNIDEAINTLNESAWFNKFTFVTLTDVYLQISYLYLASAQKVKANEFITKALSVKSDSVNALSSVAELQLEEGKKADAIANLRKALQTEAGNENTKLLLARALLTKVNRLHNQNDINEAKNLSKDVLEKTSDAAHIQSAAALYAKANIENSKFDEASNTINSYLKKFPHNTELQSLSKQLQIEIEGAAKSPG